jgi:hypothetical protein
MNIPKPVMVVRRKKGPRLTYNLKPPRGVRVGFPYGRVPVEVINKATWNEYGTRNIPERPFMRNAMRINRNKYLRIMRRQGKLILRGEITSTEVLNKLGQLGVSDIVKEINTLMEPPLHPSTIAAKGSSKPLIDTGEMRAAVTYEIVQ